MISRNKTNANSESVVDINEYKRMHSLSYCPVCKSELVLSVACSNSECSYISDEGCVSVQDIAQNAENE